MNKQTNTPEHWYIEVTKSNIHILKPWHEHKCASHWVGDLKPNHYLLSEHPHDTSCYWNGTERTLTEEHPEFQKITLEQFQEITTNETLDENATVKIGRDQVIEYWEAATSEQREYLNEHFKLDGTTTVKGIRGLYEIACSTWKPIIKQNHPLCFSEDSKYFDFSSYRKRNDQRILKSGIGSELGLCNDFIEIRNGSGKYGDNSFWLAMDYKWEIQQDGDCQILIPTKK